MLCTNLMPDEAVMAMQRAEMTSYWTFAYQYVSARREEANKSQAFLVEGG